MPTLCEVLLNVFLKVKLQLNEMKEFEGTEGVYLDTNMIYDYVKYSLNSKKYKEPYIIKLLSDPKIKGNFKIFISYFTAAEIIVRVRKDFGNRYEQLKKNGILGIIASAMSTIDGTIIYKDTKLTQSIIDFADLCKDKDDIIHVEIAKNENLGVATDDDEVGRICEIYDHIVGKSKFIGHLEDMLSAS
jgi:hypothetical protein